MSIYDNQIRLNLKNLHLCIFRNTENNIALSDVFAIIENTIDSDHLYTYIPVSPKTALFLVKTKYYITVENRDYVKEGNLAPGLTRKFFY